MSDVPTMTETMPLTRLEPGRWATYAGDKWLNPGGGLWGGYAIGLAVRVLEAEPEARGEALSLTLSYAASLPAGDIEVRTQCLRQGGSVGVWQVELLAMNSEQVAVHVVVTLARRPGTPRFSFAKMPDVVGPESLPNPDEQGVEQHYGAATFERRPLGGFPPTPGESSRSLAWTRSRFGGWDKALMGMVTDSSAPRSMYALGGKVMTTTLSLTVYLHASGAELTALGDGFILIECEGRVGGGGASDERSSYWSRDGRLLATSEQLAWYREG